MAARQPWRTPDLAGRLRIPAQVYTGGKRLCYLVGTGTTSKLRVADLDSGRSEPLLPGFPVVGTPAYDISPDGLEVVFASRGQDGKPRLWLAPLDRRAAPRPVFAAASEVFFRKTGGASGFAYRIREDGTGLRKVIEEGVADIRG